MILIENPAGWLFLSLSSCFVSGLSLLFFKRRTYHKPNAGEYILSAFNFTFIAAFVSAFAMALYALLYGLTAGIEQLVLLAVQVDWDPARIASLGATYAAVPAFWLMSLLYTWSVADDLTPETAGLRSPYYFMLNVDRMYMRTNLYKLLAWMAVLAAALFLWPRGWIPLVMLQIYLFLGASNFETTSIKIRIRESSRPQKDVESAPNTAAQTAFSDITAQIAFSNILPSKRGPEAQSKIFLDQVVQLYQAGGWDVEMRPRTQDPSVDPLLVDVDLMATQKGRTVIVDVSSSAVEEEFSDFQRPAAVVQAVWSLVEARSLDPAGLGASLVLVNKQPGEKIRRICERLGINLVQIRATDFQAFDAIPADDETARSHKAEELLRLPNPVVA